MHENDCVTHVHSEEAVAFAHYYRLHACVLCARDKIGLFHTGAVPFRIAFVLTQRPERLRDTRLCDG